MKTKQYVCSGEGRHAPIKMSVLETTTEIIYHCRACRREKIIKKKAAK